MRSWRHFFIYKIISNNKIGNILIILLFFVFILKKVQICLFTKKGRGQKARSKRVIRPGLLTLLMRRLPLIKCIASDMICEMLQHLLSFVISPLSFGMTKD
ncbi:hypothetical protein SAMD00079811_05870 [Scytonema sp. HK-05]|nr:hypothetical protein NIES2130_07090 [Scytonema sp. HK-05]BAY43009.1 hypothetical protein SAMD00079811_05870 [Scytonema sp. HK-05]